MLSLEKGNLFGISGFEKQFTILHVNISRGPNISIISLLQSFDRFGIALIQLFSSNKHDCTKRDKFCDCS